MSVAANVMEPARISGIYLYPIKSTAGISVGGAEVKIRGLAGDRRWMVVDTRGEFITGREFPRMVKIRGELRGEALTLNAPEMPSITVAPPASISDRVSVTVWDDSCKPLRAGVEVNDWLSRFLGLPCRLVYMDEACVRAAGGDSANGEVSFADNHPLLLISSASLDDLNTRLSAPVDMRRFRPNLVTDGTGAYAEDQWNRVRIGETVFRAVERCHRCAFTTIDPDSAERHPDQEPLRTLSRYRRGADGAVYFGRYLLPDGPGRIRVGDEVTLLD